MSTYVETGLSEPEAMVITLAAYAIMLCVPLAITYIATGLKGSFKKQVNLSAAALITLIAGCFVFYGPAISYTALALATVSLGFSVYQVINRHKIE